MGFITIAHAQSFGGTATEGGNDKAADAVYYGVFGVILLVAFAVMFWPGKDR